MGMSILKNRRILAFSSHATVTVLIVADMIILRWIKVIGVVRKISVDSHHLSIGYDAVGHFIAFQAVRIACIA